MQSLASPASNYSRCKNRRLYCAKIDVPRSGFSLFNKSCNSFAGRVSVLLFMHISRSPFQHNLFFYFSTAGQACAKGPWDICSIPSTPHPFSLTPGKGQAYFKCPGFISTYLWISLRLSQGQQSWGRNCRCAFSYPCILAQASGTSHHHFCKEKK